MFRSLDITNIKTKENLQFSGKAKGERNKNWIYRQTFKKRVFKVLLFAFTVLCLLLPAVKANKQFYILLGTAQKKALVFPLS